MVRECPQFVNHEIPQQHYARGKNLYNQVVDICIFNTDIHDGAVKACADGGDHEEFCKRFCMALVTLKGIVIVEYVID